MDQLRQAVIDDSYDGAIADIKELFLTVAKITGYQAPEIEEWKAEIIDLAYSQKRRDNFLASFGVNERMVDMFRGLLGLEEDETPNPGKLLADLSAIQEKTQPIRRNTPKIGCNDPCACGSEKKFKKCCGK
jgi:uncharacterized protein YecA (UPF0149 family)